MGLFYNQNGGFQGKHMTLPLLFAASVDAFCAGFFALVAWACSVTFHLTG